MIFVFLFFIAANFVKHLQFLCYIYLYRDEIHLSKVNFLDQDSLDFDRTICFTGFHFSDHFLFPLSPFNIFRQRSKAQDRDQNTSWS